ncbi:MAG: N-acetyltransferase [Promicromonosporaceae bacterium]|nr:N-acetyltransferase [Promicromonosporaceae bacterium]
MTQPSKAQPGKTQSRTGHVHVPREEAAPPQVDPADMEVASVENDGAGSRYVAHNRVGTEMGWLGYRDEKGVRVLWTTVTHPEFRGHGVASKMTRKVMDDAVASGTPIDPVCWYASEWVQRNPQYSKIITDPGF